MFARRSIKPKFGNRIAISETASKTIVEEDCAWLSSQHCTEAEIASAISNVASNRRSSLFGGIRGAGKKKSAQQQPLMTVSADGSKQMWVTVSRPDTTKVKTHNTSQEYNDQKLSHKKEEHTDDATTNTMSTWASSTGSPSFKSKDSLESLEELPKSKYHKQETNAICSAATAKRPTSLAIPSLDRREDPLSVDDQQDGLLSMPKLDRSEEQMPSDDEEEPGRIVIRSKSSKIARAKGIAALEKANTYMARHSKATPSLKLKSRREPMKGPKPLPMVERTLGCPPGELWISVGNSSSAPVIVAVLPSSPMHGILFPGDMLVTIDEVNVRMMKCKMINAILNQRSKKERIVKVWSVVTFDRNGNAVYPKNQHQGTEEQRAHEERKDMGGELVVCNDEGKDGNNKTAANVVIPSESEIEVIPIKTFESKAPQPKKDSPQYQRTIVAPAGKIGIALRSSRAGPSVHTIKPTSALVGKIALGDIILKLDGEDTSKMKTKELSKLIAKKAGQERELTILSFMENAEVMDNDAPPSPRATMNTPDETKELSPRSIKFARFVDTTTQAIVDTTAKYSPVMKTRTSSAGCLLTKI